MTVIHKDQAGEKTKWLVNYLGHCISADSNPHMCVRIIDDDGNYHKVGDLPEWPAILERATELAVGIKAANERRDAEAAAAYEASEAEYRADPWNARIKAAEAKARARRPENACAVFLDTLSEGSADHKAAVKQLAAAVGDVADLQEACAAALATPSGSSSRRGPWRAALVRLVVLAERVRAANTPARPAWQRDPYTVPPAGDRQ
jgi:hypothetical protein